MGKGRIKMAAWKQKTTVLVQVGWPWDGATGNGER